MSVKAKFKVTSITQKENWVKDGAPLSDIKLNPVVSGDPESENAKFYAASPSGEINLVTVNPDAAAQFEVGKEYYITFEKAGV